MFATQSMERLREGLRKQHRLQPRDLSIFPFHLGLQPGPGPLQPRRLE